jgi:hypothetical protein
MTSTPKLGVGLLATNTAQKEVVVNEALVTFDALIARSAKSRTNTPPTSPADGDTYVVGTIPTGEWAAKANQIAFYFNGWRYVAPTQKMKFFLENVSQWWTYSGAGWTADPVTSVSALDDLSNVSVASPSHHDILQFDNPSGQWLAQPVAITVAVSGLSDVNLTGLANGQLLAWSASASKWVCVNPPTGGGASALSGLSDVNMVGAANGKFLRWNGSTSKAEWQTVTIPGTPQLSTLSDVVVTGAHPGDVLAWNGSAWGPSPAVITYSFLGMVDGPGTFTGSANKFLVVDPTESFMTFASIGDLFTTSSFKLQNLGDVPAPTDPSIGKFLQLKKVGSTYSYDYVVPPDTKVSLSNGGTSLTTALAALNLVGFDVTGPTGGVVTVTAKNVLTFKAGGTTVPGTVNAINFTGDGVGVTNLSGVLTVTIDNGGGDIGTLGDVDLSTPPTDGQALVFDATEGRWKAGAGAGGALPEFDGEAEPATYELGPFAPPSAAMFPDRWNAPSADVTMVANRGLVVQPGPQTTGTRHAGITRKLTNTDAPWVVTARVVPSGYAVTGHAAGIILQRTANSAAVFLELGASTGDSEAIVRFGSVNASGTETSTLTKPQAFNWLRLDYDGNDIHASVSGDGLLWQAFGLLSATTALGGPPDRIGIVNRSAAAHSGNVGVLVTYYDDPDFPAASRIQGGVVSLGLSGLSDVDLTTTAPTDGQVIAWNASSGKWLPVSVAAGISIVAYTADHTLATGDVGKYLRFSKGSAISCTVPANATVGIPVGSSIGLRAAGAGQLTVVAASGVTINTAETLKLRKQGSSATLLKVGTDAWDLTGDLELLP